ncbi:MAG TPA: hypothetical protein VFQ78_15615 [Candidatus Udaeobacter sp.]|jgi:hypothetical protein|nr:hypothetical protein [Candidatus Udaeobacter sp.]
MLAEVGDAAAELFPTFISPTAGQVCSFNGQLWPMGELALRAVRSIKSILWGGQLGLTYLAWVLSVNVHGFYEYPAKDRFQGGLFGVNVAKKF